MHKQFTLVLATLAMSAAAFAQTHIFQDGGYQIGYAANLNVGDSVINLSNDGAQGGFFSAKYTGSICANVYVFDASEEEIACCACQITPNGLNSLSAKSDLINNTLTPAVPSSIVIKLVATAPINASATKAGTCDPTQPLVPVTGLLAWGATLEPAGGSPATYSPIAVSFLNGQLGAGEQADLATVCGFVQAEGTGFGVCNNACRVGALSGAKN